jgi:amino acid adenylation domain-containing protein
MQNVEAVYPLSPAQQGMLFHSIAGNGVDRYLRQVVFELTGEVSLDALGAAWQGAVDRQPVLRTSFLWEGLKQPVQMVHRNAVLEWTDLDWTSTGAADLEQRLDAFLAEDRQRGIDLNRAPLMRCTVVRIRPDLALFVLTFHHIILDGWSVPILLQETETRYGRLKRGLDAPFEAAPAYRDYIAWLKRQNSKGAESFWARYLSGMTGPTNLGSDTGDQRDDQSAEYCEVRRTAGPRLSSEIREAARRYRVTTNTLIQGAWAALLSRYAGQNDVVFGSVVSGRPHELPRVEEILGVFINILPVRVRTDDDQTVSQFLQRIQREQAEARQYEYTPLADMRRWSGLTGAVELFESILVFENYRAADRVHSGTGDLQFRAARSFERTHYPLTLMVSPSGDFEFLLVYSTAKFDGAAAERILRHLTVLLEGLTADAQAVIAGLPLLTPGEQEELLVHANRTSVEWPARASLPSLFEQQVQNNPLRIAAQHKAEMVTYDALDARANRLARRLRAMGVGTDTLVAVCLDRSLDLLVALLAAVKSGGAYVPLDPEYPPERIRYMLEDSGARVLITDSKLAASLASGDIALVRVDTDSASIQAYSDEALQLDIDPENLAYVIYTSGSTGSPKGVMVRHAGVANLLLSMRNEPGLAADDVLLAITTPCFDIAALELFLPLITGAKVVIAPRDVTRDPERLAATIEQYGITVLQATPATWRMLIQAGWKGSRGLKILCGGEALPRDLADALLDRAGSVWNVYGPTETTIWSTVAPVSRDGVVTIGRPIANTTVYILDRNMQPVPIGVAGDLYIGGAGLARGYHNRPELTAERFVLNPFVDPESRIYRTGDLARYRPDRTIECLGREDHQLKIRGFRVELGEIEVALRQHDAVREAVVVAVGSRTGDPRLAAYIAPNNGVEPADSELRAYLKKILPDYMVPASFTVLPELPLTPNGKIDRKALPDPVAPTVEGTGNSYIEPRNMLERRIAEIWQEVLDRQRVGVTEDFFDLGGHSLLAVRLITTLSKTLGVALPLNLLFQCRTIEQLASSPSLNSSAAGTLQAGPLADRIPQRDQHAEPTLSFGEEGMALLQQFEPESPFYSIPGGLRLRGALDLDAAVRSLETIVARHETLRSRFHSSDNTLVRSVQPAKAFHVEVRDVPQEPDPEAALDRYLSTEARRPFRLDTDLPFRACILTARDDDHTLFINFSHVSVDGWSLNLWQREFAACYTAFAAGKEPELPELPIRYSDYAAWERIWIEREDAQQQFEYWQRQLGGADHVLALPTDRPRPPRLTYRGAVEVVGLTPAVVNRLKALGRSEDATLFMVLLAGWYMLLHRYTGQEDILVGSPIANRTHPETQDLIGMFMNMLALRVNMAGQPSFRQFLKRVRESTIGAYGCQQYPFEQLIRQLHIPLDRSRTPVFQNIFILQSAGTPLLLPGLDVSWRDILHTRTAKTDVTLSLEEREGGIAGWLEYNTDLFEPATARRMARHFEHLLEQAAASPDTAVSAFALVTGAERDQVFLEWNATAAQYPRDMCTYQMIEEQAAQTPERLAVIHEGSAVSYRELNARANRFAHYLRKQGIGPDVLAGVQVERSPEMLIALLAVWKAGGAYVPLDPVYPQERRDFMIQDSGMRVLITREYLNENAAAIAAERDDNPATISTPENLAYVIYTSGSTGKPKGVEITQRALLNFLWSLRTEPGMGPDDAILAVTTISFDIAGLEMFLPLITGAHTVIAGREAAMQAEELKRLMEKHRISLMQATPATWRALLDSGWAGKPDLKVLCGGEALPLDLASRLQTRCGELWNVYGPTETTVWSSIQLLNPGFTRVLIGRPIANTTMYVLDPDLNLAPAGVVGELYIGGDGLARGYRNRPELTAEKFIENPFHPQSRLYRTGDLARWMPDGSLECFGRIDDQVKIRGFRIELGEIESVIKQQPGIRQAIVAARGNAGAQQLVAYVVVEPEAAVEIAELRTALKRRLPDYMVPAAIVTLESLPTTANGKIDRKALPDPTLPPRPPTDAAKQPADAVEMRIANIFEQILGISTVGVTDNFFDIGGHSLLAVRLISELEKAFGLNLPLPALFEASTPRELAGIIRNQNRPIVWTSLVPLKPDGSAPPFFCVHSLGANLVSYRNLAQLMDQDQPFYGLQPLGLDGGDDVHRTVEEMAAHYIQEIRRVQPHGPYRLGGVCLGGIVAFEMAQQLRAAEEETATLALIDSYYGPRPQHMPKLPDRVTPIILADYYLGEVLARHGRDRLLYVLTRIRNLFARAARMIEHAIGFGASGKGTLTRALENIHEIQSAAERNYVPSSYPGRVTLFWCSDYPARAYHDKRLGWCDVAEGGLEVHIVPGSHMSMLERGNVQVLAQKLTSCLRRDSGAQRPSKVAAHA